MRILQLDLKQLGLWLASLGSIFLLFGCYSAPDFVKPASWMLDMKPKDAPEIVQKAWEDGCRSGMGNMTNSMYRTFYKFTQDPVLREDPIYYAVWSDTFTFCRHYAYGIIRESDSRMRLANRIPSQIERFLGTQNFFDYGILSFAGAGSGSNGLPISNWGETKGTGFFEQAGSMDFSKDMAWNGNTQGLELDFRETKFSIVPW